MLNFIPDNTAMSDPIFNPQEIPKEMDIFYKNENDFLPPGKTFKDLTPEEQRVLQNQYRNHSGLHAWCSCSSPARPCSVILSR